MFWADPSGGDSKGFFNTDLQGQDRFDERGLYIPPYQRKYSRDRFLGLLEQRRLERDGYTSIRNQSGEVVMRKTFVYGSISKVETEYGEKDELYLKFGYEYLHLSINILGTGYNSSFGIGFFHAEESNFGSISAWSGYLSLHVQKTESLLEYVGATDDVLKVTKSLEKKLGYAAVIFSTLEDIQSDKFGVGTGVKAVIGITTTILATAFPVAILTYAILDITVGIATGTTLADRIANGIENATKD